MYTWRLRFGYTIYMFCIFCRLTIYAFTRWMVSFLCCSSRLQCRCVPSLVFAFVFATSTGTCAPHGNTVQLRISTLMVFLVELDQWDWLHLFLMLSHFQKHILLKRCSRLNILSLVHNTGLWGELLQRVSEGQKLWRGLHWGIHILAGWRQSCVGEGMFCPATYWVHPTCSGLRDIGPNRASPEQVGKPTKSSNNGHTSKATWVCIGLVFWALY